MISQKQNNFTKRMALVGKLMQVMNVRKHQVVIVLLLSLLVAGLDAASLGLLVPLAQGVIAGDFSAVSLPFGLDVVAADGLAFFGIEPALGAMFFAVASIILIFNFLGVVAAFGNLAYGQYLQGKYQFYLHTFVYNRYFSFGKLFFDQASLGSIRKILDYTAEIVRLVRILQNNLASFTQLVAHLLLMAWLSWRLMVLVLLIFPILYVVSSTIMKRVNRLWQKAKDVTLDLGRESFNMLSALPLVWSYSQEDEARRTYACMNEHFRRIQFRAQAWGDFTVTIPRILTLVTMLVVVGYIAYSIDSGGDVDLTRMVVFLYVASRTVPLFKVFNTVWVVVSEMTPPVREVLRLFDSKQKYIVTGGSKEFTGFGDAITFSDLTFAYTDGEVILDGVSFVIDRGSVVALVGPSGSGKSTVINLLMRFYDCPPETIFIDGVDIKSFSLSSLRAHMAVVDQDPIVIHDTLYNNLVFGLKSVRYERVLEVVKRTRLRSLVDRLPDGLNTMVGERGAQLSGGERQRVAIARALLKDAEILLLDEATSALDSKTEHIVQEALGELVEGRTALVIAHRLSTIKTADLVVYIDKGKVVEIGSPKELLEKGGAFAEQWNSQMFR